MALTARLVALDVVVRWGDDVVRFEQRTVRAGALKTVTASALGIADLAPAREAITIPSGPEHVRMESGILSIEIARTLRPPRGLRTPRVDDRRAWAADVVSAAWHVSLLAALAMLGSLHAGSEDATGERTAIVRDLTLAAEVHEDEARSERAQGDEGRGAEATPSTSVEATHEPRRATDHRVDRKQDAAESRGDREDVRSFGMIALLTAAPQTDARASGGWDGAEPSAQGGAIFADVTGQLGGLALSGVGEGAGGQGSGIGLGNIGTVGHCRGGGCSGTGWGAGAGLGRGRLDASGHQVGVPFLRCANLVKPNEISAPCATMVNGRLMPEVVQRVVRQNFGRFRACYEAGLAENPSLEGRVVIKFVIDREGQVSTTQDGGSELASASVIACVVRAMGSLSFPKPEGGIVTVVYPLALSST